MTPDQFIGKWSANTRGEAAASKEHFLDLCALLGLPTPNSGATGASYPFEKSTKKVGGGGRSRLGGCPQARLLRLEYKSRGGDLEKARPATTCFATPTR